MYYRSDCIIVPLQDASFVISLQDADKTHSYYRRVHAIGFNLLLEMFIRLLARAEILEFLINDALLQIIEILDNIYIS